MYETPRRAGALCSPGQKLRTIMDSSNAAMPPDSWPTGSLARLRRAVGMYVFGWADGCDPHHDLPQPWVVATTNDGVKVEANSADDIADKTNDDAMVNGSSHGRGRCTDTNSGIMNGLSVSDSLSTRRQRMPGSSLRLINVKCRRESLFDVMSLDVEGSETDCSAIHCFKVFQRVNVKRGPPEQTNPRDIFLESIGNIVIWPPASMSGSRKDRDGTGDPTTPQNDPLARDLVVCALDKGGHILAESDVPVEILPPNPAMFPSAYGYCGTVLANTCRMGINAATSSDMTNAGASTSTEVNIDARIGVSTSAVQCTTNTMEKTRCSALLRQNTIQAHVRPGKTLANAHSILGSQTIGSILRGHDMSNIAKCENSNYSGCVNDSKDGSGASNAEQQRQDNEQHRICLINEKQRSQAEDQDENDGQNPSSHKQHGLQPAAIQLQTDERWRAQRQMIMQQQEQARAQMEACARACAHPGGYRQRVFVKGAGELHKPQYQSFERQSHHVSEAEQQQGQQRLRRLLRRKYLEEKRARRGWKQPQKFNSTQVAHIEAADAAYNFRANRIKVANTLNAGIGTNHEQGRDSQHVANPQLGLQRRQPSQAESKTAAAQLAAVQAHLAAARAGQGKAMATPSIRRPTTSPQWRTNGSKWLQCRVRAFFVPKGNVDVFSIDGTVISWMRAQDNWGVALWHVVFDDGDSADLEEFEVADAHESFGAGPPPPLPFDAERRAQAWRQRERRWAAQKKALESKKNKSSDAIASVANKSDTRQDQQNDPDLWSHDLLSGLPATMHQSDTAEKVDEQQHDEAHADVRAFKCPDCGFEASKRNGLRVHRSRWCPAINEGRTTAKPHEFDIAERGIASTTDKDSNKYAAVPSSQTERLGQDSLDAAEFDDEQLSDDCDDFVGVSRVRNNPGYWRVNMWDSKLRQTKYLGMFPSKRKAVGIAKTWRQKHGSDAQQQMSGMLRTMQPVAVPPSAQSTQQSQLARNKAVECAINRTVSSPFTESDNGDGAESDECEICHGKSSEEGNQILLCDGCDRGFHQACYNIVNVPEGAWFCVECRTRRERRDSRKDTNPFRGVSIAANAAANGGGGGKMWRAQIWYNGEC